MAVDEENSAGIPFSSKIQRLLPSKDFYVVCYKLTSLSIQYIRWSTGVRVKRNTVIVQDYVFSS